MGCFCVLMAQVRYILLPPNSLDRRPAIIAYFIQPSLLFLYFARMGEGLVSFLNVKNQWGRFFVSLSELFALILYLSIIMILHHII